MSFQQMLVFSDLDGTLLDHYSYQATAAKQMLAQLSDANIPVILNTSKTLAEVKIIQQQLQLTSPFIIENGAAIYIPVGTFSQQPKDTEIKDGYWVKSFCSPQTYWLGFLAEHASEFADMYQGFTSLSVSDIAQLTGLSTDEAMRAKQRHFGEPINWLGDEKSKKAFMAHLIEKGANVVQGGRFIHVAGYCDKGQALTWLAEQYKADCNSESIGTIALGDGENDTAMLEAADFAVQIRSPIHSYPTLSRKHNVIQTTLFGPEGWSAAIEQLLATQLSSSSTYLEVSHG